MQLARLICLAIVVFQYLLSINLALEPAKRGDNNVSRGGFIQYFTFVSISYVWLALKILAGIALWKILIGWVIVTFFIIGWLFNGYISKMKTTFLQNLFADTFAVSLPILLLEKLLLT